MSIFLHGEDSAASSSPVVVRAEHVSKHFVLRRDNSLKDRLLAFRAGKANREAFTALSDVSVEVRAGQTVALIGHNGSGKSTLLKVIGGILDPSDGKILRRGRVAALLELGAGFHPDLSGRDNVFLNASLLGLSRAQTEAVFDEIVEFAEIGEFIDTQVKFYSSGMYVRLAFAVAIHTDPDILLVDEVLAVGDEAFQRKCMDVIRRFQVEGRTILLVTHNLSQVLELADSAVLLHHGSLLFQGSPREAVAQFRELLEDQRVHREAEHDNGLKNESGKPSVKVEVEVSVPGMPARAAVNVGQTIQLDIRIEGDIKVPGWMLSVQIDNTMGIGLFGAATDLKGLELGAVQSEARFRVTIPDTRFGEGQYFVGIYIFDADGQRMYEYPQATSFTATTSGTSRGLISMNYEIEQVS